LTACVKVDRETLLPEVLFLHIYSSMQHFSWKLVTDLLNFLLDYPFPEEYSVVTFSLGGVDLVGIYRSKTALLKVKHRPA
jgi:hypothetical protein